MKKEKTMKKECPCGSDCPCHDGGECSCQTGVELKMLKPVVSLFSALMISTAVLYTGNVISNAINPPEIVPPEGAIAVLTAPEAEAVKNYLMDNPEVLIASVDKHYQAQEKARKAAPAPTPKEAPKAMLDSIIADKTNHVLGNPKGSFVIVEFFDYNCGWCKKTNQEISKVLADAPNIRWILIDAPIFGEASETIAGYAMAAAKQGKYKEMHEAIGKAEGRLDEAALVELAKTLKLDIKKLQADAKSQAVKDKLAANRKLTQQLNMNGVPMLIVDGKINPGALFGEKLEAAVAASKAKK